MDIKLQADDAGIWRQDDQKQKYGILWKEIYSISGYTIEYSKGPEIEIEFDFEYGEYFRINETWQGFNDIIASLNKKQLFFEEDWFEKVKAVGEDDDIYTIWNKK
ncbi:MAG: hypothetical protein GY705_31945 [Bacteroidetes bacterium]|nr:hypothetical protein [Bacteroidota bacterium]